ncbi:non-phosphorylating glyceraldehyde-3-phosphate dehydrogenase (NADP) [Mycoplasma haemofelis str. Langford 1]|uniref:Non-phosphorylating glyceraldehyde-3-phosphate dehydrogenase (NADP) n=1 Tax=Mycoplasma haemofelis (strain Langford 1) TaxID=941640 RepID=E8ZGH1_MYCHL|nr:aldehyde dehydrogenase family protein [Mycoplasma haemofelis]CBY92041.1 non-phosphorylating glyceraldehyde-3-phosphate dehydrogenase (NADP) [Mycoplasma haemofelis str. Langford 1]
MYKATGFINGNPISLDKEIPIHSPIDGKIIGYVPAMQESQISEAFSSAESAFGKWRLLDYKLRTKYLLEFAAKLREHAPILQNILNLETGKDVANAHEEIMRSADYIVESVHAYSDMVEHPDEYSYENNVLIPKDIVATYIRTPIGVSLTISPFNYPVNLMITKVVPAILMGNTVVHKSALQGSLCGWYVAKIFNDLSVDGYLITPGVLNYVTGKGSDIGDFLTSSPYIKALSFTGSTEVGKSLMPKLPNIPKQMEMGGHNPAIVLRNADLKITIPSILKGAFGFSGQRCTAIKKVFVHKDIYSPFMDKLREELSILPPLKEPLINKGAVSIVEEFYKDALDKGAKVVGNELSINGNFVSPIVLENVDSSMKAFEEELFAPIIAIKEFEKDEEVVELCNNSRYGLQASIFSNSLDEATSLAINMDFGRININTLPSRSPDILPFLGIKDSGLDVQGIKDSLLFFSIPKGIVWKKDEEPKN